MVTKAPEKLINLLWFLSLSWLAIVYRLLKNIKWPMTTQDVNVAKCLGTSNQTDKIVLDPLQNTYGDVLPGSLKWTSYSVLTGFQGSVQVQFRFSQFSDTQLKSSTSSGASENVNCTVGAIFFENQNACLKSPRMHQSSKSLWPSSRGGPEVSKTPPTCSIWWIWSQVMVL